MRRLAVLTALLPALVAGAPAGATPNPDDTRTCDGCEEPVLSGFSVSPRAVTPGAADAAEVRFSVSEAASVRIYFERRTRVSGRFRYRRVRGHLVARAAAGEFRAPWDGTLAGRALKPGVYRVLAVAFDADDGLRSNRESLRIRVVS